MLSIQFVVSSSSWLTIYIRKIYIAFRLKFWYFTPKIIFHKQYLKGWKLNNSSKIHAFICFLDNFLFVTNIIRRCLHFSSSVSISIASNAISIVQSSKVSVSNDRTKVAADEMQMDFDTDSSVVIIAGTSLEMGDKDEGKTRYIFFIYDIKYPWIKYICCELTSLLIIFAVLPSQSRSLRNLLKRKTRNRINLQWIFKTELIYFSSHLIDHSNTQNKQLKMKERELWAQEIFLYIIKKIVYFLCSKILSRI